MLSGVFLDFFDDFLGVSDTEPDSSLALHGQIKQTSKRQMHMIKCHLRFEDTSAFLLVQVLYHLVILLRENSSQPLKAHQQSSHCFRPGRHTHAYSNSGIIMLAVGERGLSVTLTN